MNPSRFSLLAFVTLSLAACGGGGGGGGGGTTSNPVSQTTASQSTIYTTLTAGLGTKTFTEKIIKYFTDGSQTVETNKATPSGQFTVDSDHVTLTGTVHFDDGSERGPTSFTVEPLISTAPALTAANYPSNWKSGGTVTPPHVSSAAGIYIDGAAYSADGSASAPFRQATLTPNGPTGASAINDPNAIVAAPTKGIYDLRWGTPDPAGPSYASNFNQGSSPYKLPQSTFIFHGILSSNTLTCATATVVTNGCGATLGAPPPDVVNAWNQGWTGKGINVMIYDNIGASPLSSHPAIVQTIAHRYAWGANYYGMSWSNADPSVPLNTMLNLDGTQTSTATALSMHVINMSFGADLASHLGAHIPASLWSYTQLMEARSYFSGYSDYAAAATSKAWQGAFNFSDAVLVKSAGNDTLDAQYEPLNWYLAQNQNDVTRLLIVGALTGIGSTSNRVDIASYSNKAGTDPTIQSHFLMESGNVAYPSGNLFGGSPLNSDAVGTSYAAPRVAAYAAIVRQKFPNLTGANTADILLATARYDTLSCYPNCDKTIYGQGEASLSRALAPVGYLR
jgi:hypothetical protein